MSSCMDCLMDCLCCFCFSKMEFIEPKVMEWDSLYEDPDYIPLYLEMVNNALYIDMTGKTHKYQNMAP